MAPAFPNQTWAPPEKLGLSREAAMAEGMRLEPKETVAAEDGGLSPVHKGPSLLTPPRCRTPHLPPPAMEKGPTRLTWGCKGAGERDCVLFEDLGVSITGSSG